MQVRFAIFAICGGKNSNDPHLAKEIVQRLGDRQKGKLSYYLKALPHCHAHPKFLPDFAFSIHSDWLLIVCACWITVDCWSTGAVIGAGGGRVLCHKHSFRVPISGRVLFHDGTAGGELLHEPACAEFPHEPADAEQ